MCSSRGWISVSENAGQQTITRAVFFCPTWCPLCDAPSALRRVEVASTSSSSSKATSSPSCPYPPCVVRRLWKFWPDLHMWCARGSNWIDLLSRASITSLWYIHSPVRTASSKAQTSKSKRVGKKVACDFDVGVSFCFVFSVDWRLESFLDALC